MNNLQKLLKIFKDAGKHSRRTSCFSRIKDALSFDSKFKDNSWRPRTSGSLRLGNNVIAHNPARSKRAAVNEKKETAHTLNATTDIFT